MNSPVPDSPLIILAVILPILIAIPQPLRCIHVILLCHQSHMIKINWKIAFFVDGINRCGPLKKTKRFSIMLS